MKTLRNRYAAIGRHLVESSWVLIVLTLALTACGNDDPIPSLLTYSTVAVGDLNGDGRLDIAVAYSLVAGPPPHPGYVAVYQQAPANRGTFLGPQHYSVGNDPASIALGDLTGEGNLDIVTANYDLGNGAGTVSVLLQDPTRPGQFLPATTYATGTHPNSVAIGDLNGDGKPDLAVADSDGISVLLQNPAAPGTFLPRTVINVGGSASSVAIADLNGDGKPDLVVTNSVSTLVLLQDPTTAGTFLAPTSYSAGPGPVDAVVGDLDGDGRPDIAVANEGSLSDPGSASVSVLLQDPAVPGGFLPAVDYSTDFSSAVVVIADLNGDGRADLVVGNVGVFGLCPPNCFTVGTSVSTLLQDPALTGQFQPAINYPAIGNDFVSGVAVGDMNGDGKPDLVVVQAGSGVFIRLQDPSHPGQFLAGSQNMFAGLPHEAGGDGLLVPSANLGIREASGPRQAR